MLKTIPIINNKGGVGKTTTSVNVAAGLAHRDERVLLVDLDSQGSASLALGVGHNDLSPSIADVLFGSISMEEAIRDTKVAGLDLVTGALALADAGVRLKDQNDSEYRLQGVLDAVRDTYDRILIDCPPSTSILSVNALVAADAFIIPVTPSYLALEGVVSLGRVVRKVRKGVGEAAPVLGIVLTKVDPESTDEHPMIEELRKHYGGKVFDTEIREDPKLEDAPGMSEDIFTYAPNSQGAKDYAALLDEIEARVKRYGAVYSSINERARSAETVP